METAAAVEKPGKFFHSSLQNACWRFAQFPQARRRLTKLQNYKTGQITCYKNRTFSLATDRTIESTERLNRRGSALPN
jgi:hypothetical protein